MTHAVWSFAFLMTIAFTLPGCGGDEPVANERGSRRSKKSKKKKKKNAAQAVDLSRLPKKLQNADWTPPPDLARRIKNARDPFKLYVDDLVVIDEPEPESGERLETKIQEPPAGLQLIAIISGTAVHRAMVTDRNGVGHVLRPGDMVGDEVAYQIARITRNEVLFKPIQSPTAEKKLEDVRKILRSKEELEELLP